MQQLLSGWTTSQIAVLPSGSTCCQYRKPDVQILVQAGASVKEDVCRSLLVLLTNAPELHPYVTRQLYSALADGAANAELSLIMVAVWWLGGHLSTVTACCHQPAPDSALRSAPMPVVDWGNGA